MVETSSSGSGDGPGACQRPGLLDMHTAAGLSHDCESNVASRHTPPGHWQSGACELPGTQRFESESHCMFGRHLKM